MEFYAVLDQVVPLLRQRGRVTYRALKLQFTLDDNGPGPRCPPDIAPAEAYYQQALALAEELGMRPLMAHCHHGLGRLYHQTAQREQARAALTTAIALYRTMDMTFWLPQAEAVLAQVA